MRHGPLKHSVWRPVLVALFVMGVHQVAYARSSWGELLLILGLVRLGGLGRRGVKSKGRKPRE